MGRAVVYVDPASAGNPYLEVLKVFGTVGMSLLGLLVQWAVVLSGELDGLRV